MVADIFTQPLLDKKASYGPDLGTAASLFLKD